MKQVTKEKAILIAASFIMSLVSVAMSGLLYTLYEKAFGSGTFWVVLFGTLADYVFTCLIFTVFWYNVKENRTMPFSDTYSGW